jgi:hypothetical protein
MKCVIANGIALFPEISYDPFIRWILVVTADLDHGLVRGRNKQEN